MLDSLRYQPVALLVLEEAAAEGVLVAVMAAVVPVGAEHRVGLTWTRLAVGEDCRIEATGYIFYAIWKDKRGKEIPLTKSKISDW